MRFLIQLRKMIWSLNLQALRESQMLLMRKIMEAFTMIKHWDLGLLQNFIRVYAYWIRMLRPVLLLSQFHILEAIMQSKNKCWINFGWHQQSEHIEDMKRPLFCSWSLISSLWCMILQESMVFDGGMSVLQIVLA